MSEGTIVVSGATGFLGSHLCKRLVHEGYSVVGLKRSTSGTARLDELGDRIVLFDVDEAPVAEVIYPGSGVTAVVHAAVNYGRNGESRGEIFAANFTFPYALLRSAIAAGVKTFVNSDTILPRQASFYSEGKGGFLVAARGLAGRSDIRLINMRLQHMYGPGDGDDKFVTHVIRACASHAPELLLTAGEQRRDFVYIDDVVAAYSVVLARQAEFTEPYVEYDVGSGVAVPVRELVELVHRLTRSRTHLKFGALPYRANEVMFAQADVDHLASLGWQCRTSHSTGLLKTIELDGVAS